MCLPLRRNVDFEIVRKFISHNNFFIYDDVISLSITFTVVSYTLQYQVICVAAKPLPFLPQPIKQTPIC